MIINFTLGAGGGTTGGTSNYNDLQNKPQINAVTLSGNTTLDALDLAKKSDLESGDFIVGMTKQIYSPTGTKQDATFIERTSGGGLSVGTGIAQLRSIEANTIAKEPVYEGFSSTVTDGHLTASFSGTPATGYTGGTYTYTSGAWSPELPEGLTLTGTPFEGDVIQTSRGDSEFKIISQSFTSPNVSVEKTGIGTWPDQYFRFVVSRTSSALFSISGTLYRSGGTGTYNLGEVKNMFGLTLTNWEDISIGDEFTGDFVYSINCTVTEASRAGHLTVAIDEPTFKSLHPTSGTYPFTYSSTGWSEDLTTNGISVTGTPLIDDVISVSSTVKDYGTLSSATPDIFWATSLNLFDKDDENAYEEGKSIDASGNVISQEGSYLAKVRVIGALEDGYVAYDEISGITKIGIAENATATTVDLSGSTQGNEVSICHPTTSATYVYVATSDIGKLCIHPQWSGYRNKEYRPYELSIVNITNLNSTGGTLPAFIAVGNTRNEYDFENGTYTQRVESIPATEELIQQYRYSKVWGTDYVFDDNHIYQVLQTPVVYELPEESYQYQVDDFGFEGFADTNVPVKVSCLYYMTNLVDKLRRDVATKADLEAIELNKILEVSSLPTTGVSDGTVYNYDGHLYRYTTSSGYTGEWFGYPKTGYTKTVSSTIAYYYDVLSQIPNNTVIATFQPYTQAQYYFFRLNITAENIQILSATTNSIENATLMSTIEHNGAEGTLYIAYDIMRIKWYGNVIQFSNKPLNATLVNFSNPTIDTPHYFIPNKELPYTLTATDSAIVYFDDKGRILKGDTIDRGYFNFNKPSSGYNLKYYYKRYGDYGFDDFYAPTVAGNSGQILKSNGGGAPTWDTPANLIGGVTFWTGTQEEYDALASHSSSVVYIIKED